MGELSVISGYSAAPSNMSRARSATSLAGQHVVNGGTPKAYDWSKLDQYASYLHEQDCIRQHMGIKALQKKLRMDLDQQVAQKQTRRTEENEEEHRYHQNSMVELERWKQMEQ